MLQVILEETRDLIDPTKVVGAGGCGTHKVNNTSKDKGASR